MFSQSFSRIVLPLAGVSLLAYFLVNVFLTPTNFPKNSSFVVNEKESLKSISERLEKEGYIRDALLFRSFISFLGKDKAIHLGEYAFTTAIPLPLVIAKFIDSRPPSPLISVTIPEGSTVEEMALILSKTLPGINVDDFKKKASTSTYLGFLFPSTYYLLPSYKTEDVLRLMNETFLKKTGDLLNEKTYPPPLKTKEEVIVLASIVEGEAKHSEDMKIIAGILLKRLTIGMPIQVDVAKETYKEKGLPDFPINNPGLVAIEAVLNPKESDYLYYITGNDGIMYYAKTFTEHKNNIKKYLK